MHFLRNNIRACHIAIKVPAILQFLLRLKVCITIMHDLCNEYIVVFIIVAQIHNAFILLQIKTLFVQVTKNKSTRY